MAELLRKQYDSTFSKPQDNPPGLSQYCPDPANDRPVPAQDRPGPAQDCHGRDELTAHARKSEVLSEASVGEGPPEITDAPFNFTDIADAIDQLSLCSGPGPDGISAILLKKSKITVSLMLFNIFHESMDKSEIPDILKLGFICPILKPDSKRERPASWRPVSLTSHVVKTLERVLRRRIVGHLEANNLMDPDQHRSRSKRSCLSQLLEHHDEILKMIEEGGNVDVIYTDFKKAYEKIDNEKLLDKIKNQFGIKGKLEKWIKQFLLNRKQQVLVEEHKSEKTLVTSGAIQGSVLGPVFVSYVCS